MTLPSTPPISLSDVLTELRVVNPGRGLPISLGDADVRALAGKPSGAVSLSDLYGKSSYVPMTVQASDDYAYGDSGFSGGTLACYPTVSVTGGRGNKTYQWRFVTAPGSATLSNANQPTCTVMRTYTKASQGVASVNLQCDVTDATGATVTSNTANATFEWG